MESGFAQPGSSSSQSAPAAGLCFPRPALAGPPAPGQPLRPATVHQAAGSPCHPPRGAGETREGQAEAGEAARGRRPAAEVSV